MRATCASARVVAFIAFLVPGGASAQWPAPGIAIPGADTANVAHACADGSGGFYVSWQDSRNYATSRTDIYAQHMTGAGTRSPEASPRGVPLCAASGDQTIASVASDLQGGTFV